MQEICCMLLSETTQRHPGPETPRLWDQLGIAVEGAEHHPYLPGLGKMEIPMGRRSRRLQPWLHTLFMRYLLFPQAEITALPAAPVKRESLEGVGNGYPKFAYYPMKGSDGLYPSDRNP